MYMITEPMPDSHPEISGRLLHRADRRGQSGSCRSSTLPAADGSRRPSPRRQGVGRALPAARPRGQVAVASPSTRQRTCCCCHGCLRGGDVVELARLAWGYDRRDAHVAAAMLLMEFGHEVPQRPPAWFRKQERQKPVRDALEQVKVRSARRRLMRAFGPLVASIKDPEERREEAQRIWQDLDEVARLVVERAGR